jgi:hypothetical protein
LRRLFRLDIRSYLQLGDDKFIVFCDGDIFLWRRGHTQPIRIGHVLRGRGPLRQGCCLDDLGNCYYGEYWPNRQRESVGIYVWRKGATNWDLFFSFPESAIRHVHAVQFDPVSRNVWVATGDHDHESIIGYFDICSSTNNPRLNTIASGKQMTRAVSLLFTPDYVYWGSDGGRGTSVATNHIYRWSRHTKTIEPVVEVGGPVYFSAVDSEGRLFVSTVVEGSSSETDSFARVWMSADGTKWREIGQWKKDKYPFIFGYATLFFPGGMLSASRLYVTADGVQGRPGTWVFEADDVRLSEHGTISRGN